MSRKSKLLLATFGIIAIVALANMYGRAGGAHCIADCIMDAAHCWCQGDTQCEGTIHSCGGKKCPGLSCCNGCEPHGANENCDGKVACASSPSLCGHYDCDCSGIYCTNASSYYCDDWPPGTNNCDDNG